jgi:hypothetical protein
LELLQLILFFVNPVVFSISEVVESAENCLASRSTWSYLMYRLIHACLDIKLTKAENTGHSFNPFETFSKTRSGCDDCAFGRCPARAGMITVSQADLALLS